MPSSLFVSHLQPYLKLGLKELLDIYEGIRENRLVTRETVWKKIGN